jgi:hypothetical protein
MAAQLKDSAWLEWIAGLMGMGPRTTLTAALSPGHFHCLLDELPLHLIPAQGLLHEQQFSPQQFFLNPDCLLLSAGQLPAELEMHRHLLEKFSLRGTVAWVRDAAFGSVQPFWLGPRLEAVVRRFQPGKSVDDSLPVDDCLLLAQAGILTQAELKERRLADCAVIVRTGQLEFREKNYFPLRSLIHPFHVAALRRYYRHEIRRGAIRLGDHQSSRRFVAHNESVARYFHYQIANAVSAIVGEPVKPSYVYLASYLGGAELKKHTDREQCEFSVTLCLDFAPEPDLATPWPIRLDTPQGKVTVYQALGDGLVYRGTKVPHYREPLAEGYTSTSIFFHYVPQDFSRKLD